MRIVKVSKKKYPLIVYPTKGHAFRVPSQHNFKNKFVDDHGCSLVAFYISMSFLGKKKSMGKLLRWSKKHLDIKSKIPLNEVYKGLKNLAPKNKRANIYFRRKVTAQELRFYLAYGCLVIFETKNLIHSNPLMWDDTKCCVRNFSNGKHSRVTVGNLIERQCTDATYRGCIIIKP